MYHFQVRIVLCEGSILEIEATSNDPKKSLIDIINESEIGGELLTMGEDIASIVYCKRVAVVA